MTLTKCEQQLNELFEMLVPYIGPAETVAGEILRATARVGYRWHNDGDQIGVGYGKETCNPAARYLEEKCDDSVSSIISDMWCCWSDDKYDKLMQNLFEAVLAFLRKHPELEKTPNNEDMWDYYDKDEDRDDSWDEEDY